jgi:hypothetical protein
MLLSKVLRFFLELFTKIKRVTPVSNFKEFLESMPSKNSSEISVTNKISSILTSIPAVTGYAFALSKPSKEDLNVEKFSTEVSKLAYSGEFLDEFSKDIGQPKENESEDEFVNRAKKTMKDLLRKKLSK